MGLFDFIKKQFIDVIQWTDQEAGIMAYRFPMADMEIQNGAQLVVRETQCAMFVNEGQVADIFGAGTHRLTTQNLPVLTNLKNWTKLFESPFKSDVYFFNLTEQLDQKWGTTQPITVRDQEFGAIRIRAFGNYAYKISDARTFWTKLCGNQDVYTVHDLDGQLRAAIMVAIATCLGQKTHSFVDLAANQAQLSQQLLQDLIPSMQEYGITLTQFTLQSLSLPEELEKHLDKASSMRIVGNLQQYTQFQVADSIPQMAEASGGLAGAGAGLAAGAMMGQTLMQNMAGLTPTPPTAATPVAAPAEDPFLLLEKLAALKDKGIISQQEFDAKKADILSKI